MVPEVKAVDFKPENGMNAHSYQGYLDNSSKRQAALPVSTPSGWWGKGGGEEEQNGGSVNLMSNKDTARETRHTGLVKNELDMFNKAWYYQNRGTNIKSHAHTTEFHLQNVPQEASAGPVPKENPTQAQGLGGRRAGRRSGRGEGREEGELEEGED